MFLTMPKNALLLCLVLCTALLQRGDCFSLFSKKKTPATSSRVLLEPTDASKEVLRGIPPHHHERYQTELFQCGQEIIPRERINDDYCDCLDGSDEPGTSACHNGVFTCQNKGFKPLQLASSRVDDGVCDCCDGSDEDGRQVQCEDTCDAQAAASRQALQKSMQAYEAGAAVRAELIRDVTARVSEGETTLAALDANDERLTSEVLRLQEILAIEVEAERAEQASIKQLMLSEYAAFLGLEQLQEADLALLIANLFTVYDVIDEDVPDLLVALQKDDAAAMRPPVLVQAETSSDGDMDMHMDTYGDDEYHDDYDDLEDEHGERRERRSSIPEYKEAEEVDENSVAAATSPATVYTASNCNLLKIEMDDRLAPFCALETKDLRRFVVNYLISRKATKEAQLIFGFFALKKTFADSADFVTENNGVNNQPATPCPPELEAVEGLCAVHEGLRAIMDRHNFEDHKKKGAEDMRSALRNLSSKQADTQKKRREHEDLVKSSKDYVGFYDLLAMQNQCFDKTDGQYTYSVCIGKDVRQKDTGGGSSTLLGSFQSPASSLQRVESPKQGGLGANMRLKFERGQHCHAFGPRSAEVMLECGGENKLLEASEPSTCFYSFRMQSPVACNDDFARSLGLTPAAV